jgi:hypothetical protein
MNNWTQIFEQARRIAASSHTIEQALEQAIAAARRDPVVFDEPGYWDRAAGQDLHATSQILRDWATEGLGKLVCSPEVGVLILDLGDCPETFSLYQPGGQSLLSDRANEQNGMGTSRFYLAMGRRYVFRQQRLFLMAHGWVLCLAAKPPGVSSL